MERQAIARSLMVTCDLQTFPCQQAHVETGGTRWWELRFLHAELVRHHEERRKLTKWTSSVAQVLATQGWLAPPFFFHWPRRGVGQLGVAVANTTALLALYAAAAGTCNKAALRAGYIKYLTRCCRTVCDSVTVLEEVRVADLGTLRIAPDGRVAGFQEIVQAAAQHPMFHTAVAEVWHTLAGPSAARIFRATLHSDLSDPALVDVVLFAALALLVRSRARRPVGTVWVKFIDSIRGALLP